MSLRARILALFLGLGVVPILLLGGIGYTRSMKAVRGFLEAETSAIAHEVASELEARYELRLSELLLLSENAETQRLYRAHYEPDAPPTDSVRTRAKEYLSSAWARVGSSYRGMEFVDLEGRRVYSLPPSNLPGGRTAVESFSPSPSARIRVPIVDLEGGQEVGTLSAQVRLGDILPNENLGIAFGESGFNVVLDRERREILFHPSRRFVNQPLSALLGKGAWNMNPATLSSDSGSFQFHPADSNRVASFVTLTDPPWTVISTASMEEFAPPFQGARQMDLLIVLLLAGLVGGAFLLTIRRATASLEALTEASERVGKGDLNPPLPPTGPDEVGRLSAAFGLMVHQVRAMLKRMEETREMAIMGELASNISHQIRNPLTSIKLNLQGLEEEARNEGMSETSVRALGICLREVAHLEDAVRQIRGLARTHPPERLVSSLHALLTESAELLGSQLEAKDIRIELNLRASNDQILADPEDLKSVFVNLLVNAEEAMGEGGSVVVSTSNPPSREGVETVLTEIRDEGPGIPVDQREQVFRPFVSTKKDGTGFGLAIARLTVQEHHGNIRLGPNRPGATVLVEFPVHAEEKTT